MGKFFTGYWAVISGAILLAVCGVIAFRTNLARYVPVSGYAFTIALLRTAAFLAILAGTAALAWGATSLFLPPGIWRWSVTGSLFFLLLGAVGAPVLRLVTRIIEVRYYL